MTKSMRTYFRRLAEGYENGSLSKVITPILSAAEKGYQAGSAFQRSFYSTRKTKLPFPVISVGNLTWGGTGKTPFVEYLARKIASHKKVPVILTRGYSRDEVEQLKHHIPEVLMAVGKDRVAAAKELLKTQKMDAGILDDGLQHWPIHRDVEVVMLNALNPFGNGHLIPRGILREPLSALQRADFVVISHSNLVSAKELTEIKNKIYSVTKNAFIVDAYLEPLFFFRAKKRVRVPIERLSRQRVTTFSAIGAPRSFQLLLSHYQIRPVRNFEFTDHHTFSTKELEEIKTISEAASVDEIITTEKDFYRDPDGITQALNPLVLAAKLRIKSGEEIFLERVFRTLRISH